MNFNGINQIGIVGGGVSALMLCIEAAKLGIRTTLLDPQIDCIGAEVAAEHMLATITNENIQKLSLRSDIVIFNRQLDYELNTKLHAATYPSKMVMNELSNPKNMLELLEELEIPTAKVYHEDNRKDAFSRLEEFQLPFKFIKQYDTYAEMTELESKDDIADLILEMDEEINSFILQPITEYKQILVCFCIMDKSGKIYLYEPLEEAYEDKLVCSIKVADSLSKTMVQKIARYNRKILKELDGEGIFTIKYGVKANKSLEFIEITPELAMAGLLTLETHEVSIYEQYMHMLLDMPVVTPVLQNYAHGTIKELQHKEISKDQSYHLYNLGLTNLCITREK